MKQLFYYFKIWKNDYTVTIYLLKIFGRLLTALYFLTTFLNTQKTKDFNQKRNYFVVKRREVIKKYNKPADDEFNTRFLKNDRYDFKGIYLPKIENANLMRYIYDDSLKVYTEYGDNYNYELIDELDKTINEGTYCYISKEGVHITINEGDVVIDAGAWIGDFSAYAAKKGAQVYAFEPSPMNIKLLEKTIEYNKGSCGKITIVPFGLGEKEENVDFFENIENTGGNAFNADEGSNITLAITTLDLWAEKNSIEKINFIKSDIEGYERQLLRGATNVLRKYSPTLSICTYHFEDDREVLKEIILKANPNYKIIQRKMKLFAYIEK